MTDAPLIDNRAMHSEPTTRLVKRGEPTELEARVRDDCRALFDGYRLLYPELTFGVQVIIYKNPNQVAASHLIFKAKDKTGTQS